MIVDSNPELRATGEHWNAGHKSRESVVGAEKDVLGRQRIVAANEASCLWRDVCCLEQSSTASGVRSCSARWGRRQWSTWRGFARCSGGWVRNLRVGGAEIPAPDSGISFRCGWIGEESAVPPGESGALGDGVPPCGCGAGGGPVACESGFP